MTSSRTVLIGAAASILALSSLAFLPVSAMAGDETVDPLTASSEYNVAVTTDGVVKLGVKAYRKGDYAKSVSLHKAAIRGRMSKRKTAVAQSNLCASWAMLGDLVQAEKACETALELRPDYGPALANLKLLNIKLAKK